jgi:hypothetical protein
MSEAGVRLKWGMSMMGFSKRILPPLVGGIVLTLAGAFHAAAVPIDYAFSVTATSGPLAGDTENGTFSYDSSSITPGNTNAAVGLLTDLSFTWDGFIYDQTIANTGDIVFDNHGNLTNIIFGNDCRAGSCDIVPGSDNWVFQFPGNFFYFVPDRPGLGIGRETLTLISTPVPEPSTWIMIVAGFVGLTLAWTCPSQVKSGPRLRA